MSKWKAVIISQSNLDSNGVSEVTFDILKDDVLTFVNQVVRVAAGEEMAIILSELTRHFNEDSTFVPLAPGTEILLP